MVSRRLCYYAGPLLTDSRISFVRKHDRDRHHLTHRESKTFKCTQCGEDFARSDALLRHGAKPGACKARMGMGI